jgi:hypothetical protein
MAREVLRYFLRYPDVADGLEGVARWRLLQEAVERRVRQTDQALSWLVERGFLQERSSPGTSPLFSLNPERRGEAERFLSTSPPTSLPQG